MSSAPKVPDRLLAQKVALHLINHGIRPPCRVDANVHNGVVTLTGVIQFDNQRRNAIRSAQAVPGVTRVVDQMRVLEHKIWEDRAKAALHVPPPMHGGEETEHL